MLTYAHGIHGFLVIRVSEDKSLRLMGSLTMHTATLGEWEPLLVIHDKCHSTPLVNPLWCFNNQYGTEGWIPAVLGVQSTHVSAMFELAPETVHSMVGLARCVPHADWYDGPIGLLNEIIYGNFLRILSDDSPRIVALEQMMVAQSQLRFHRYDNFHATTDWEQLACESGWHCLRSEQRRLNH